MWILGLCVVAVAATACLAWDSNQEYHYKSDVKMLNELDKKVHQHAGFIGRSNMILQYKDNAFLVRIEHPEMHTVNERPDPEHPHEHHFHSLPSSVEQMAKPFRINLLHGAVTSIQVSKDEPLWSVNVKKAIAAKLQLQNLNSKNESEQHFYTRSEDGASGECEMAYEIDLDNKNDGIFITKTKDFKKCESLTYRYYDNENLQNCFYGEHAIHKPIHKSETTHIDLKGTRQNYHITKLRMVESFLYAPYGVEAEFIKGIAKLKVELTGIVPVTEEMKIADDAVTHHDLHSKFENADAEIKDAEDLKSHPYGFYHFLGQKHSVEKVAEIFERLMTVDDGKEYTEVFNAKPMPFIFMELYYAMTSLNYDELKDLYENHVKKEGQPGEKMNVRKQVFKDALVSTGTSSAFMLLKDKLTSGKLPHHVVFHLLSQIPMSLHAISEPLLEEFYSMCKSPALHDKIQIRKSCYLAFSTVVHEQCVSRYHKVQERVTPTEKIHCTPEIAEKFFQKFLAEPESQADDSYSRTLLIKVAGNFGTLGSLKELMKIVHDDTLHPYYKFIAIMALEHHLSYYSEEVVHAMLPIYYSGRETQEVRIAALVTILYSEPELQHLEAIAEDLAQAHDGQVVHYAMSAFEQFAKMESPCYTETAENCKRVLRHLKRLGYKTTDDFRHSFTAINDRFNHKYQIGGGSTFNYITSNDSYVPQSFYVYLEDYVGRTSKSPLYFGYVGYGLDQVIDNFFGFRKNKDAQTPSVEKELKEFDEKLNHEVRKPDPMLGEFFINTFGSTLDFLHFNDTTFADLAKQSSSEMPSLLESMKDGGGKISFKRFLMGRQKKFVMPSALGWPFAAGTAEVNFVHYRNNKLKVNIDPRLLAGVKDDGPPPTAGLQIYGHLVFDQYSYASMGSVLPAFHLSASAGIHARDYYSLPLKLKIAVDPITPKLIFKYTPILPHTRYHGTFTPITMIHNMSNPEYKEGILPYHHKKNELIEVEEDLFHDYLGYGIHFKSSVSPDRKLDSIGSFRKFMMENDLRTRLYYLQHNPMAVAYDTQISLTPATKDQATEIDIEFTIDHWGFDTNSDKSHEPPFPAVKDGHEDYINSQGDRKARTCVAKIDVLSKGAKERKLHIGLGYTHTFDDRYHQLNLYYDRSPFGPKETDHFKICSSASVLFPHVDMQKMYALDTAHMDPNINVSMDIHFGKNCENDKKITVRAEMERTDEHKKMQAELESPDAAPDNWDAKLYRECKKNIANGHRYSRSCRKYWYRSLKVREYKSDIELINFNDEDKLKADEHMEHLDSYLKHYLYYYLGDSGYKVELDDNKKVYLIDANFSATTDHVDIRVVKPDNKILEFHHVPHPHYIQARSATPFFEFTNKMMRWSYYKFPFCAVEGNKVHSFDGVHYNIPPMDCHKVLAKDCSQNNLFTILDKKVANNRFHKAIKVFLGTWLIEALPISADSDIVVRVNGQRVVVTEAEPHYHYEKHNDKDDLMFTISYDGLFYKIRSRKYGVIVYYDGNAVVLNLSAYYRGKQCGLCGDFNNKYEHDFVGAKNCYYQNATDFSYSYAIPGDGCQVPKIVGNCKHHQR